MEKSKKIHLVCKDNENVTVRPSGIFVSGYWKLGADAALKVEFIYLHQTKDLPSYRQGRVVERYLVPFEGQQRYVFAIEPMDEPLTWKGEIPVSKVKEAVAEPA